MTRDELYALLPAIHRLRDHEQGEPLRALLGIVGEQLGALEEDIDQLYRDAFVETCADDRVPYIGDLLGVTGMRSVGGRRPFSLRGYVGRTIAFRRRKGTVGVLEELGSSVTGWSCRAVEFFQQVHTTQHLDHVRLHAATLDLRDADVAEATEGPFHRVQHTAEVRTASGADGRYGLPHFGLFFWRLEPLRVEGADPRPVPSPDPELLRFTFDPAGRDAPLFAPGATDVEVDVPTAERDAPGAMRARAFAGHLGPDVLTVLVDGAPVPPERLRVFTPWRRDPPLDDWDHVDPPAGTVAVDVARGRLVMRLEPGETPPAEVLVRYHVGVADHLGAGSYPRPGIEADVAAWGTPDLQIGVRRAGPASATVVTTLTEAAARWHAAVAAGARYGVVQILDSRTYDGDVTFEVPRDGRLVVVAAGWPDERPGAVDAQGLRPCVRGTLAFTGAAASDGSARGAARVDGLLVDGIVRVEPGDLGELRASCCTVLGAVEVAAPGVDPVATGNLGLALRLDGCVVGPVEAPEALGALEMTRTVARGVEAVGARAELRACTLLGPVDVHALSASDTIFEHVEVRERQSGCLRFCWVPPDSRAPRRYRCQPDLALSKAPDAEHDAIVRRLRPSFTSRRPEHPAFVQLRRNCAPEIREGGSDGGEIGVYHDLHHPTRLANLARALEQYARVGLDIGTFFLS